MSAPAANAYTDYQARCAALLRAVYAGDTALVNRLLDAGADINARDRRGWTPLARAIQRQHFPLALELIQRGADVNTRDVRERTPLCWAAQYGTPEIVQELLARGANPLVPAYGTHQPLTRAALYGRTAIAQLILQSDAWPRGRVYPGMHYLIRALQVAVEQRRLRGVICFLEELEKPGAISEWFEANREKAWDHLLTGLLVKAAEIGHAGIVRHLCSRGAKYQSAHTRRLNALVAALHGGHSEVAEILREQGATYTWVEALLLNDVPFFAQALESGKISANEADPLGGTLLTTVASYGSVDIARLLLQHGANPNARTAREETVFMQAAQSGSVTLMALLQEHGANPLWGATKEEHTSLRSAAEHRQNEALRWLLDYGGKKWPQEARNAAFVAAAEAGSIEGIELLLEHGANAREACREGRSPLPMLAHLGNKAVVSRLLTAGVDVNAPGPFGGTPLEMAIRAGRWRTTQLLLEAGADPNVGECLYLAVSAGRIELARALLERGADPNQVGKYTGRTPLDQAFAMGRIDLITLLAEAGAV